ncbi:hypothetical protein LTR62_007141 [Meristemomyces frigidus]|uniref:Uncharacterized protein n=1 Tax=Meristemomyces frigidus TaxID=1508187 RepID=A0AAN7TCE9_9PEZI|nr:hypothetical protein LTR62_007141 [Meristemomyces frigidus]
MVLDDATAFDAFSTSPSPFDPYTSNHSSSATAFPAGSKLLHIDQRDANVNPFPGVQPIAVNLDALPRRFSLIGPLSHPECVAKGIQAQCTFVANMLQRPVIQDEANALAFHFTNRILMAPYGAPAGIAIAMGSAYRGNKNYRFSLWTPIAEDGRFSKDFF